ncbi:MAG: sigma-70 family RNA polymerase sigma factor [Planctomycetes bacterium]|nr:sigma-70 family RNA polymerase sigma factor [Planctomycetota bacterium]
MPQVRHARVRKAKTSVSEEPREAVSRILRQLGPGRPEPAAELLPLVYGELRRLAKQRLAGLPPGQTLQPTALVHEAYLKLVGSADPGWDNRAHFFVAAARAMRDILVDQARRRASLKRGGDRRRADVEPSDLPIAEPGEDVLALHEALERLEHDDPRKAQIVMLRYFAGLDRAEVAELLGVTTRTIDRDWRYIVARLHRELNPDDPPGPPP